MSELVVQHPADQGQEKPRNGQTDLGIAIHA